MVTTIFQNGNTHPITGGWIYYRFEKGTDYVEVSMDSKRTWKSVPVQTTIYNESDFARFIYGFKAGIAYMSQN
jgi:hypothetical protein